MILSSNLNIDGKVARTFMKNLRHQLPAFIYDVMMKKVLLFNGKCYSVDRISLYFTKL